MAKNVIVEIKSEDGELLERFLVQHSGYAISIDVVDNAGNPLRSVSFWDLRSAVVARAREASNEGT